MPYRIKRTMELHSPPPDRWANYEFQPSFVLGFHGCDKATGEGILSGKVTHLNASANDYDWLGSGIYFWEGNPIRALHFARERARGGRNSKGNISSPFILGAIINLKRCLNLADSGAIYQLQNAYHHLKEWSEDGNTDLPTNGLDYKARDLDCLVFNTLHRIRQENHEPAYDTVRGLFWEGKEIYPGAGVREANHIQICVRDTSCILGYFRPIETHATV